MNRFCHVSDSAMYSRSSSESYIVIRSLCAEPFAFRGSYPPPAPRYSYELRNLINSLFKRNPRYDVMYMYIVHCKIYLRLWWYIEATFASRWRRTHIDATKAGHTCSCSPYVINTTKAAYRGHNMFRNLFSGTDLALTLSSESSF